jgi:hypothetical protein
MQGVEENAEQHSLYLFDHEDRIKRLEERCAALEAQLNKQGE